MDSRKQPKCIYRSGQPKSGAGDESWANPIRTIENPNDSPVRTERAGFSAAIRSERMLFEDRQSYLFFGEDRLRMTA